MSWNLKKGSSFLPKVSLERLTQIYKNEKSSKAKVRLLSALHRKKGRSLDDIAERLDLSRNTVHGWLTGFQERGIKAKDPIKQPGRTPDLSKKQKTKLMNLLKAGPAHSKQKLWSTMEVKDLIKKTFKVDYVREHVSRLLHKLGFSLQVPRREHPNRPSDTVIEEFKKKQSNKQSTTKRKVLLWGHKTKRPLV